MHRRIGNWASVVTNFTSETGVLMTMYGLTYDTAGTLVEPSKWEPNDISQFIKRLHYRMGKRLLAYAWVAEMQERGVIHYHVVVVHRGFAPKPDRAYTWTDARGHRRHFERLWTKGNTHTDWNVRSPYYLVSYLKKEYQKDFSRFPAGAHAWAVWISDEVLKMRLRFLSLSPSDQNLVLEYREAEGVGFREAFDFLKWDKRRVKLWNKHIGNNWEYMGSVSSAHDLASWGITDKAMQEKIFSYHELEDTRPVPVVS